MFKVQGDTCHAELVAASIVKRLVKKSKCLSFHLSLKTHPLTPSLFYRGGTPRLATSYLLSIIERRPRGEFRKRVVHSIQVFFTDFLRQLFTKEYPIFPTIVWKYTLVFIFSM
jgi:hypothetical protein